MASNRGKSRDVQLERIENAGSFESLWYGCLQNEREHLRHAERIILALRRRLIELDAQAPRDEYDGSQWSLYEGALMEGRKRGL